MRTGLPVGCRRSGNVHGTSSAGLCPFPHLSRPGLRHGVALCLGEVTVAVLRGIVGVTTRARLNQLKLYIYNYIVAVAAGRLVFSLLFRLLNSRAALECVDMGCGGGAEAN